MQTELLNLVKRTLRETETRLGYSAWRHGETDVEIIMHQPGKLEQHVGYVTSLPEAIELVQIVEAKHMEADDGTDDKN